MNIVENVSFTRKLRQNNYKPNKDLIRRLFSANINLCIIKESLCLLVSISLKEKTTQHRVLVFLPLCSKNRIMVQLEHACGFQIF